MRKVHEVSMLATKTFTLGAPGPPCKKSDYLEAAMLGGCPGCMPRSPAGALVNSPRCVEPLSHPSPWCWSPFQMILVPSSWGAPCHLSLPSWGPRHWGTEIVHSVEPAMPCLNLGPTESVSKTKWLSYATKFWACLIVSKNLSWSKSNWNNRRELPEKKQISCRKKKYI